VDGNIWGGEVLRFSRKGFTRLGQLQYHPLPGGDLASVYPSRMLASILSRFMSDNEIARLYSSKGLLAGLPQGREELEVLLREARSGGILTSSTGRVLDAASAFLGFCLLRSYEGEPAIRLEASSRKGECSLEAPVRGGDVDVVDTSSLFEQLVEQDGQGDAPLLAFGLQHALGEGLGSVALSHARRSDHVVAVSGGAAVNTYLIDGIREGVKGRLKLVTNSAVPPGDGGIALGQCFLADSGD
jgi:hydrogenase maturation protein HypF